LAGCNYLQSCTELLLHQADDDIDDARATKASKTTTVTARALHSHGKDTEKRWVSRRDLKTGREDAEVMC